MCFKFAIKLLILCSFRMTFTKKKSTDDNEKTSIVSYRYLIVVLFFSFNKSRSMTFFLSKWPLKVF